MYVGSRGGDLRVAGGSGGGPDHAASGPGDCADSADCVVAMVVNASVGGDVAGTAGCAEERWACPGMRLVAVAAEDVGDGRVDGP